MDFGEFEDQEQERFLDKYYSFERARLILTNLRAKDHPAVRTATKQGLRKGIEAFLGKQEDKPKTIYCANLAEFCFDGCTIERVQQEVRSLRINLVDIPVYAEDVHATFGTFIYNESLTRFRQRFPLEESTPRCRM